jgi:hypothetical protein
MEPGRQPAAKVIARSRAKKPIIAVDQGSCRGHKCSETSLTGDPGSIVSVGASPGCEVLDQ